MPLATVNEYGWSRPPELARKPNTNTTAAGILISIFYVGQEYYITTSGSLTPF
jgi:hypothetical protein